MISRDVWLNGGATKRQYFGQYVTDSIRKAIELSFSLETLVDIEDIDDLDATQLRMIAPGLKVVPGLVDQLNKNNDGWAISVAIEIYKEAARQVVEQYYDRLSKYPPLRTPEQISADGAMDSTRVF